MKVNHCHTIIIAIVLIIAGFCTSAAGTELEWNIEKKADLKSPAVDMAISMDGSSAFLLGEDGNLYVYKMDGTLQGTISVGKDYDLIQPSPEPDTLLLSNRKKKTVDLLTIEMVQDINIKDHPFKGPKDAPVVLSFFTDFQCPYCAQMGPYLDELLKEFPKELKLVYKSFPLRSHRFAEDAAKAAMAAYKMGKFWEFHDLLFKNYSKMSKEKIEEIRDELGLDKKEFEKYLKDPSIAKMVSDDLQNGIDAGVRGTPTLFINGKQVKNRRLEAIKETIRKEIKKAEAKK